MATRFALEAAEVNLPSYADEFPEPCACGACPHARKQTATSEVQQIVVSDEQPVFARWYRCGVCGHEHKRAVTVSDLTPKERQHWRGEHD